MKKRAVRKFWMPEHRGWRPCWYSEASSGPPQFWTKNYGLFTVDVIGAGPYDRPPWTVQLAGYGGEIEMCMTVGNHLTVEAAHKAGDRLAARILADLARLLPRKGSE